MSILKSKGLHDKLSKEHFNLVFDAMDEYGNYREGEIKYIMIHEVIKPENEIELKIISDERFIEGALWGKPRNGHPEGKVIYHIGHVLNNINKYSSNEVREKLRLVTIVHDTFKKFVDPIKPKSGENHHAMLARRFAEKYITEEYLLDIIELHDEAYNSWCKGDRDGKWDKAEERAIKLIERLGDSIEFYLVFYRCDGETGDKNTEDYTWFSKLVEYQNKKLKQKQL